MAYDLRALRSAASQALAIRRWADWFDRSMILVLDDACTQLSQQICSIHTFHATLRARYPRRSDGTRPAACKAQYQQHVTEAIRKRLAGDSDFVGV